MRFHVVKASPQVARASHIGISSAAMTITFNDPDLEEMTREEFKELGGGEGSKVDAECFGA